MGPHRHLLIVFDVDGHALGTVLIDDAGIPPGLDCLGQQPFSTLLADAPPPARQRLRIDRRAMLEESLPGEVLVIGVLDPARDGRLIRQPIGCLIYCSPATSRGSVAGRPFWDGKKPAHACSKSSQSINAASFTNSCRG